MNTKNRKNKLRTVTSFCDVRQVEGSEDTLRFRFTDKTVDRHGTVIIPDGIVLDNFKNNPQVLFMHDNWTPSVGRVDIKSIEVTSKFVDGNVIFDRENDPFAELLYHKYKNKFMNAVSVGFWPIEISDEAVAKGQRNETIIKWELWELTLCTLGSNPNALQRAGFIEEMRDFKAKAEGMGHWNRDMEAVFSEHDCSEHMKEMNDRHVEELARVENELKDAEAQSEEHRRLWTRQLRETGRLKQLVG